MEEEINADNFEAELDRMLEDGAELPSTQKLMEMLKNANISEEMRSNLKNLLGGSAPELFGSSSGGSYLGLVFIVVIFFILFFFGYKLYKSIRDKQVRREEKKKAKQMKKKK